MGTKETAKQSRQQLSKGMEHIRYAVTVDPAFRSKQETSLDLSSDTYGIPSAIIEPIRHPPSSRSHDPSNKFKRSDPFQFGSRYLQEGDDIFEFNAWDHVEVDEAYKKFSEEQFNAQRAAPVNEFERKKYLEKPEKYWDLFYGNNAQNFFKDRKWLQQEFPILEKMTKPESGPVVLLEVGAGAGNTAFPILTQNENPNLKIHACDFSEKAVDLIRSNELYTSPPIGTIQADVWDVASHDMPPNISENGVDVVLMVFIFSALAPTQWTQAIQNIWRILKPGGQVLFRDYGRGDLAQVRFKKGRYLEENFYIRGDGTRVYFFEKEELENIWTGGNDSVGTVSNINDRDVGAGGERLKLDDSGGRVTLNSDDDKDQQELPGLNSTKRFTTVKLGVDRRLLVNRQRKLKMYRCWIQAMFKKL